MSKGLEATKRLKWGYAITHDERINLCECIEKELNEYQQIQKHFNKYKKDIQNSEGLTDLDLILMLIHNGWWVEVKGQKIKKALEIIKRYIHIYCIAPNDCGGVRIWLTQDGKHYVDIPQKEYDLLKEVLL